MLDELSSNYQKSRRTSVVSASTAPLAAVGATPSPPRSPRTADRVGWVCAACSTTRASRSYRSDERPVRFEPVFQRRASRCTSRSNYRTLVVLPTQTTSWAFVTQFCHRTLHALARRSDRPNVADTAPEHHSVRCSRPRRPASPHRVRCYSTIESRRTADTVGASGRGRSDRAAPRRQDRPPRYRPGEHRSTQELGSTGP